MSSSCQICLRPAHLTWFFATISWNMCMNRELCCTVQPLCCGIRRASSRFWCETGQVRCLRQQYEREIYPLRSKISQLNGETSPCMEETCGYLRLGNCELCWQKLRWR